MARFPNQNKLTWSLFKPSFDSSVLAEFRTETSASSSVSSKLPVILLQKTSHIPSFLMGRDFRLPCREKVGVRCAFFLCLIICFMFTVLDTSSFALDVPPLRGYVNDYAGMISPQAKTTLESELRAFEQTDSTQIVILTIPSLEGGVLEEFSIKVAEAWKIGQKVKDNGAIFLVAQQERKIRIEVGRGLEGRLTDLMAGRVIDLVIKPRFKRGDFDGGFIAGTSALIDATRGEFKAEGNHTRKREDTFSQIFSVLFISGIILLVLGSVSRILAGIAGAVAFPVFARLIPGLPSGIITYAIAAALGFGAGMIIPRIFSASGRDHHRDGGYWMGGGGYGGGGFGSGGFSGGGGGFGGGGASGGW